MSEQKHKFPAAGIAAASTAGCLLLVIGSIIVWVWVGEVRTSCNETYVDGWGFSYETDHWHCTAGTESDVQFWNGVYSTMWKLGITLSIIAVISAVVWTFIRD